MKIRLVLLFTALAAGLTFGQDAAKASVSAFASEIVAGKNVTMTITLNDVPSVDGKRLESTQVRMNWGPKDKSDPTPSGNIVLGPQKDPRVYSDTFLVPPNAKGVWVIKDAMLWIPGGGDSVPLKVDAPDFRIKSSKVVLPTSGTVKVAVP
jgi:hypothetical protein